MSLEIRLTRVDRTYQAGQTISGVLNVNLSSISSSVSHNGLTLRALGQVKPQNEGSASSSQIAKVVLLDQSIKMLEKGTLPGGGIIELPFEFVLEPLSGMTLQETYHGVYVNVKYALTAVLLRTGFMAKPLDVELEFVAEVPETVKRPADPADFTITPESMQNVKKEKIGQLSKFLINGRIK
jgi:hypothetical protein